MEDEKIIIINEENSYDTVVVENTDEILYDETIHIVELDEPEIFTVETDEAFPSLGGQNGQLNHALLHNRDLPDQHIIESITGLRQELDGIHALKTVESDKCGSANYYMWQDDNLPPNRVGYFVSVRTRDHKICRCNEKMEIFGVTVGSAGFVGGQQYDNENKPRSEEEYALVAHTGVVKVRCLPSVVAGDYVMSNNEGRAKKTNNGFGYYVISIDTTDGTRYAVISLDSTMNQVYDLSQEVDTFNERMDNVEIRTNAAINAATEALKQGFEAGINSALQNSQNALDSANSALEQLGGLDDLISTVPQISEKVDLIEDNLVLNIQNVAQEIVHDSINNAIETNQSIEELRQDVGVAQQKAEESLDEVRSLTNEMTPLREFTTGDYKGILGIVDSAKDNTVQLATISQVLSNDYETIDSWDAIYEEHTGTIFYAKDTGQYYYYDIGIGDWVDTDSPTEAGLLEVIASLRQKADNNESMIEGLTSYTGKNYTTIPEWNGYEQVDAWSQGTADPYIIYRDNAGVYHWCDISDLENPWKSDTTPPRNDLEKKDTEEKYYAEDTKLYYYYNNGWHASDALSSTNLIESIALTKQLANKNESRIDNIVSFSGEDGKALAELSQKTDNNESLINSLTSYVENNYTKLNESWDETKRTEEDRDTIFYALDPEDEIWKYWYWNNDVQSPDWVGSPNPADAGLVVSIVNVQQQASKNEANITSLLSSQTEINDAIIELRASVGEDGASVESLVMNLSTYTVGKYSQAYGLTVAEAKDLLRDGTVFVPTDNTEEYYGNYITLDDIWSSDKEHIRNQDLIYYAQNSKGDWEFWSWDEDTSKWVNADVTNIITPRSFSKTFYYVWDKSKGTWGGYKGVDFVTSYQRGGSAEYIVIEDGYESSVETISTKPVTNDGVVSGTMYYIKDDKAYYYYYNNTWYPGQNPNFEVGALYYWNTDKEPHYWQKVATLESNTLNRAISQIKQTEHSIESSVTDVKGNVSFVSQTVDNLKSQYITQTHFDGTFTSVEQKATVDTATLSMLAATGIIATQGWSAEGKDTNKVYYDTIEKKYYYYKNQTWNLVEDMTDPNVVSKIKSAGIITAINNGESTVTINADKVNLQGYVTISNLRGAGTTTINGANITTGIIKSKNRHDGPLIENSTIFDVGDYQQFRIIFDDNDRRCYQSDNSKNGMAAGLFNFYLEAQADVEIYASNSGTGNDLAYFYRNLDLSEDASTLFQDSSRFVTLRAGNSTVYKYQNVSSGWHTLYVGFNKTTTNGKLTFYFTDNMYNEDGYGFEINLDEGKIDSPNFKVDSNGDVTINGVITANDLATEGRTTIHGANITTGIIKSQYYDLDQTTGFATQGMAIDLDQETMTGKNFKMDDGNLIINGMITSTDLSTAGSTTIHGSNITTGVIKSRNRRGRAVESMSVTSYGGTGYTFVNGGNGYYESNNHTDNTVAMCCVSFTVNYQTDITFQGHNSSEYDYDYGMFSYLGKPISSSSKDNSGDVYHSFKGNTGQDVTVTYYDVPAGTHEIYVSYRKDGDTSNHDDCFRFRMTEDMFMASNSGTEINLNNGTIDTPNFKVDGTTGNVDITGKFTTNFNNGQRIIIDGYSINLYDSSSKQSAAISFCSSGNTWDSNGSNANLALAGDQAVVLGVRPNGNWNALCKLQKHVSSYNFQPISDKGVSLGTSGTRWDYVYANAVDCNSVEFSSGGGNASLYLNDSGALEAKINNVTSTFTLCSHSSSYDDKTKESKEAYVIGDILICTGRVSVESNKSLSVTFAKSFKTNTTPRITLTADGEVESMLSVGYVGNESTNIHNDSSGKRDVIYIAIGIKG